MVAAIRPTLVVTASHGYSGLRRWALGSVTDRVVSTSAAPVLVVRGDTAVMPPALRRILVPLDGSQRSAQALPFALLLARCAGAQLTLLSVLEPPVAANPYLTAQCRELVELKHAQALGQLKATASALRAEHGAIAAIIGKGYPAEEIVATAERQGVDLIVMATHGYSGFQRWALGSVADKVLHASSTPLILVRSQDLMGERGPREARRE
jgi:nucleotide-binding universal stress UspA family protein